MNSQKKKRRIAAAVFAVAVASTTLIGAPAASAHNGHHQTTNAREVSSILRSHNGYYCVTSRHGDADGSGPYLYNVRCVWDYAIR